VSKTRLSNLCNGGPLIKESVWGFTECGGGKNALKGALGDSVYEREGNVFSKEVGKEKDRNRPLGEKIIYMDNEGGEKIGREKVPLEGAEWGGGPRNVEGGTLRTSFRKGGGGPHRLRGQVEWARKETTEHQALKQRKGAIILLIALV